MKKRHLIFLILGGISAIFAIFILWQLDLPNWKKLDPDKLTNVRQTTLIYDGNGEVIGSLYGSENRLVTTLDKIPLHVQQAFIAAEDLRFYEHNGIDPVRILGALWQNIKSGGFSQGASTITQQLIKLTHLTSEKTLSRKAQEAVLALQLERVLSKEEILENYLNTVYFGKGAYGIEAAANTYFSKSASELTIAEGALLAGIIKSPSGYAPHLNPERAILRRNHILTTMEENGFISPPEADHARSSALTLSPQEKSVSESGGEWYMDSVLLEAATLLQLPAEEILSGGYHILTSFDHTLQAKAEVLYTEAGNFPDSAADGTPVQSAFVAMDPETGEVKALIGGRSYDVKRGLNRATQIKRQPGSAIKPVSVYAAAIDACGYLPSSFADDTQRVFAGSYAPGNSGGNYYGTVTLREALSRSLNVATVDLTERIGLERALEYARKFGLSPDKNDGNLSFALGSMTYGVSPLQLCSAYSALANNGRLTLPHLIRSILNADGKEIYRFSSSGTQIIKDETAYLITDMLKTAAQSGSARALSTLSIPVAAKTGTVGAESGGNRDAWTVAYTPDLAVCVWMGFDNSDAEHELPSSAGGGNYPARLTATFFRVISDTLTGKDFPMPSGLRSAMIDLLALEQNDTVALVSENTPTDYACEELFYTQNIPKSVSRLWDAPDTITDIRLESKNGAVPVISFTALDQNTDYILIRKCNKKTEVASVLSGSAGELLHFADTTADLQSVQEYKIIPRHRLLYERGILLTGEESYSVRYTPGGLLNRFTDLLKNPSDSEPENESPPDSVQSIFD